jgi:hypothetical protein
MNYLANPFWIAFCIINIICWGIFGLFLFTTFLIDFVVLQSSDPELLKKIHEFELKIKDLEKKE